MSDVEATFVAIGCIAAIYIVIGLATLYIHRRKNQPAVHEADNAED